MSLTSCHNRHKTKSLTNSKKARDDVYPNFLRELEFLIAARMGLTSDITYLRTAEGFMYHCVIRDIVTGDVLRDYMAVRMTKYLVLNSITAMLTRTELTKGCIFLSDRGSQYVKSSDGFTSAALTASEFRASWDAGRQCMVGKLLRDHEKRADTLDVLRDERISENSSV